MNSRVVNNAKVTQYYSNNHKALDIVGDKTIKSYDDGVVIRVVTGHKNDIGSTGNNSYGNYIIIDHLNGYRSLYAHLKTVNVKLNEKVKMRQKIGIMGDSGNAYGVHLHFELKKNNKNINPYNYIFNIFYRVYTNKWDETKSIDKISGNLKNSISGIQIKNNITYRVHLKNGKWLSEVNTWNNTYNGYAGIYGKDIDLVSIKGVTYRVHTDKWLPWVSKYGTNKYDCYAGIYGKSINAIQIRF